MASYLNRNRMPLTFYTSTNHSRCIDITGMQYSRHSTHLRNDKKYRKFLFTHFLVYLLTYFPIRFANSIYESASERYFEQYTPSGAAVV